MFKSLRSIMEEFGSSLENTFSGLYPASGVDPLDKTLNGSTELYNSASGKAFMDSRLTRATTFFGLPNRKLRRNQGQSVSNLFLNFIGWQEDAGLARLIFNFLVMVPLNLIFTPLRFLHNLLKFAVVMLPGALGNLLLTFGMGFLGDTFQTFYSLIKNPNKTIFRKFFEGTLLTIAFMAGLANVAIGSILTTGALLGGYFADPIDSIRGHWKAGYRSGGVIGGLVLTAIAIVGIGAVYAIALPLLIQASLPLLPYIANLPPVLLDTMARVAIAVEPALSAVGAVFLPAVTMAAKVFTFGLVNLSGLLSAMPPVVGLGVLTAGFASVIGAPMNHLVSKMKEKWYGKSTRHPVVQLDAIPPAQPMTTSRIDRALNEKAQHKTENTVDQSNSVTTEKKLSSSNLINFLEKRHEQEQKKKAASVDDHHEVRSDSPPTFRRGN